MTFKKCHFAAAAMVILVSGTALKADGRSFVWTYQYQTMPRGTAEVEYYTTFSSPLSPSMSGTTTAFHELELEIGMNDSFDIGLYQRFKQLPGGSFTYEGFKVRAGSVSVSAGSSSSTRSSTSSIKGCPTFLSTNSKPN